MTKNEKQYSGKLQKQTCIEMFYNCLKHMVSVMTLKIHILDVVLFRQKIVIGKVYQKHNSLQAIMHNSLAKQEVLTIHDKSLYIYLIDWKTLA